MLSFESDRSFHLDFHPHPGMEAALKAVFPLRQIRHVDLAALQDSCLGHRNGGKPGRTFWNRGLSRRVEGRDEAAAKLRHLGEGMDFAALVDTITVVPFLM